MSRILINRYLAELARTRRFSGLLNEEVIREAFNDWLRRRGVAIVASAARVQSSPSAVSTSTDAAPPRAW